jgi:hypothetical protein
LAAFKRQNKKKEKRRPEHSCDKIATRRKGKKVKTWQEQKHRE